MLRITATALKRWRESGGDATVRAGDGGLCAGRLDSHAHNHDDDHVLRPLRALLLLPTQHDAIMDDLVSSKGEPSPSAVTGTTASATSMTFQATQTVQEHDVRILAHICAGVRGLTCGQQVSIFVAAQRGDVDTIRSLIESGKASATDRDEQNITPLHWAAINAQLAACRYLLDQGAEIDALGGDLVATPMQWAARNGYLYIIQLLIAHNADPNIADAQGYNTLHLVTHSSSVMALLYLLHQPINVDARDSQGHTSLMWAAYQIGRAHV